MCCTLPVVYSIPIPHCAGVGIFFFLKNGCPASDKSNERLPAGSDTHPVEVFPAIRDWNVNKRYKEAGGKILYDQFGADNNKLVHNMFLEWVVPLFRS